MSLLTVEDLRIRFDTERGPVRAVDGTGFRVEQGEVLGLVGESGSGKTMLSLAVLRMVPRPGTIESGRISFDGQNLLALSDPAMAALRGDRIAMIFQNPANSLNPLRTVGAQLSEILRHHRPLGRREAADRVASLLQLVGLSDPGPRMRQYPHEMSGGMKQRVCIARALLCDPALVLADEPTTALDVTIQAQILDLLADLRQRLGTAMLLVTHDMGVVARMADRIAVMYAGRVCEEGPARELFHRPLHPYTRALLQSVPRVDTAARGRLPVIAGRLPNPREPPSGCRFRTRCPEAIPDCARLRPLMTELAPGHAAACLPRGSETMAEAA